MESRWLEWSLQREFARLVALKLNVFGSNIRVNASSEEDMNVSSAGAPNSYEAAVLVKMKEQQKIEGQAAQQLIEGAASVNKLARSGSVGRHVNTVA